MRKILLSALLVTFFVSISFAEPLKIGMLSAIGLDENGVRQWTENVAHLEGKTKPFKNDNYMFFYENLPSMIMALRAGQVDRLAISSFTAEYIAERNANYKYIDNHHNAILGYSLAVLNEKRAILRDINLAIFDMKIDGTITKLMRKYILELGSNDPDPVMLPVINGAETIKIAITGDLPPMDCILADGTPAGFNTALLAELSKRIKKNFSLVAIDSGARAAALKSGRVDVLFWTRSVYNDNGDRMPYPLDKIDGIAISEPYLLDSRAAIELKK